MRFQHVASVAVVLLSAQLVNAFVDLGKECPGNLLQNAGFEEPNTEEFKTQLPDPTSNSKWGWYESIPGTCTAVGEQIITDPQLLLWVHRCCGCIDAPQLQQPKQVQDVLR
jgi:hypothetical protein